jgi:erythromycin esterase-like protein
MNGDELRRECAEIRAIALPLTSLADLDPLVSALEKKRFVCLGEASHGTHEFYAWRCEVTRRLIEEGDIAFIGVEGDWPDCWHIDRWVRGLEHQSLDARHLLLEFERWPTWMWANEEVADFLDWMRTHNLRRPEAQRVGFYGLDVYSLWDSLREVFAWLERHAPEAVPIAASAWRCFAPFNEDPQSYARTTALVPETCEQDVINLLVTVRKKTAAREAVSQDAFAAAQNAEVVAGAERYYRAMVRSNRSSWNVRDFHMADTLDRLIAHCGTASRAVVWAHNTHVGDARATDMAGAGMVNLGQVIRERHGVNETALVGFASHRGSVVAAATWGDPDRSLPVPEAARGSHEDLLHIALDEPSLLVFPEDRSGPWLSARRGHRAIGVVYQPIREAGNYVPTVMGERYDALLWFEDSSALAPLRHEPKPSELEFETEPSGY